MSEQGKKKKRICVGVAVVIAVLVVGYAMSRQAALNQRIGEVQERMAKEVLRFHVLANSDSESDQTLKMEVKQRVLCYMQEELPESESVEMTKQWAMAHLEEIETIAYQTIVDAGYDYAVRVQVAESYFPEKRYGDVVFPEGMYEALRIEIGAANGQNWWCVLYPNLCFTDVVCAVVPEEGKDALNQVLDEEAYEVVTGLSRFKIKWFFFQ